MISLKIVFHKLIKLLRENVKWAFFDSLIKLNEELLKILTMQT